MAAASLLPVAAVLRLLISLFLPLLSHRAAANVTLDQPHVGGTIFTILYDADGDQQLSAASDGPDLGAFAEHLATTPRNALKIWRRLDRDGDGMISVDELALGPSDGGAHTASLLRRIQGIASSSWAKQLPPKRVLKVLAREDRDMAGARELMRAGVGETLKPLIDSGEMKKLIKAANRER